MQKINIRNKIKRSKMYKLKSQEKRQNKTMIEEILAKIFQNKKMT